ncbi:MAG: DHH family phosphoesterase [Candidatus Aquicultor sp.]
MKNENNNFKEIAVKLKEANSVAITIHVSPDGDALGSLLAMTLYLKRLGKAVCATWGEEIKIPAHYAWLPGIDAIRAFDSCIEADVLLTLDCANEHRLGLMEEKLPAFKTVINIDHHIDNSRFGTINLLDFNAAAACEIVYDLLHVMEADITPDIATLLYVGIVTDTGRFQYQNTTAKTLRVAADLVDHGVYPNAIFEKIYENTSFASLKMLARILERAEYVKESGFIYSYVLDSDLKELGITMSDTENYIDYIRTAKEAGVVAIFKETPDGKLKVSLRSKGIIDVGSITREAGGGGHRNAAGATLDMAIPEAVKWISSRVLAQKAASATR